MYALILLTLSACQAQSKNEVSTNKKQEIQMEKAVFAGGCFWCIEAAFDQLKGVKKAESGYAGGHVENPTYKQVCTGETGHAEVVEITYDPSVISYDTLLEVFWVVHDPTQLNRQGEDVGTQYRSAIFYLNDEQKEKAEESMKKSAERGDYSGEYVTLIEPLDTFYPAEAYHEDYFEKNPLQPYCSAVIAPKMQKFRKKFASLLK